MVIFGHFLPFLALIFEASLGWLKKGYEVRALKSAGPRKNVGRSPWGASR